MRIILWLLILAFVCFSLGLAAEKKKIISLGNASVLVEVCDTNKTRQKGLMFRDELKENEGMLFVFEKELRHSFWMRNMRIPIDIIWISEDKKVVDIIEDAKPCQASCPSLVPAKPAKYVLEVSAGFVKKNQIKAGAQLRLE
ncbi:MAG: DUF192 domain-containing protein [Candidatus Omnitrophica bacterium]|nr:DUF192 domain-containing protein [Candidatus Omnitrophota bacterium]